MSETDTHDLVSSAEAFVEKERAQRLDERPSYRPLGTSHVTIGQNRPLSDDFVSSEQKPLTSGAEG